MKLAFQIDIPDWASARETQDVMHVLNSDAETPSALFVGGCVRNEILEKRVDDIDIATIFTPDIVLKKLQAVGIKAIPTGIEHGTITAVIGSKTFEITTLRVDKKTDGRHADVSFTDDWLEDAKRRDFTMNTLLMDLNGRIFDPTGLGVADLKARRVVFVGNAEQRIQEDYLRILRLFRFHAYYGEGAIDAKALRACEKHAGGLKNLSKERITHEFLKIIAVKNPSFILGVMRTCNILPALLGAGYADNVLSDLCAVQHKYGRASIATRVVVLANFSEVFCAPFFENLRLPNVFIKEVKALVTLHETFTIKTQHDVQKTAYFHGKNLTAQLLFMLSARSDLHTDTLDDFINVLDGFEIPLCPVNGNDLLTLGFDKGKELGDTLKNLETLWVESDFKLGKEALLATL